MPAERKYSLDQREKAGELCIYEGLILEAVADRTQIPLSTIKRWASEDEWLDRQKEHYQNQRQLKIYLERAQIALLKEIVDSGNTGVATAAAAIIKTNAALNKYNKQEVEQAAEDIGNMAKAKGLPEELAEEFRRKILGIGEEANA